MIHIPEEKKFTQIYLVTNCYEDPNKVYIGKEKSHKKDKRKWNHRYKFGCKINFDYIDQTQGWDKKDWKPLECFWIRYFKFLGFIVLNENEGGGGASFYTEETKQKISKALKGRKITQEHKNKISNLQKGIKKGNYHTEESKRKISEANKGKKRSKETKEKISKTLKGREKSKETKNKLSLSQKGIPKTKLCKPIIQYDLNMNPIKEWDSQTNASKIIKIHKSGIGFCLTSRQKTAGGYIWKYKN